MWRTSLLICAAVCVFGFSPVSAQAPGGSASSPQTRPAKSPPVTPAALWDVALTPKMAMKYGHLALFAIQCVPLDRYFYADDAAGRTFIEACSNRAQAGLHLAQAARERFGSDAAKPLILETGPADEGAKELIESGDPAFATIDRMREVIDNGKATLRLDQGADHAVVHARFTPDGWKINFSEVSDGIERHGDSLEYKQPDAMLAAIAVQGEIDQALAKEVAAGKFESVDALKAERDKQNSQKAKKLAEKYRLPPKDDAEAPATQPARGK